MESYGKLRKNISAEPNSMQKFIHQFSQNQSNRDFRKAQEIIPPRLPLYPNITKLSLNQPSGKKIAPIFNKENFPRGKRKQSEAKVGVVTGIEYLPAPLTKKPLLDITNRSVSSSQSNGVENPKRKSGSDLVFITGNVQFVLKTFKMHPNVRALYEVFGYITKMYKGKIRFEQIIIMRSESGPVLQGFYFDFTNLLSNICPANCIRCVGQFTRENRFHIHKIQSLVSRPPDSVLTRIQNVNAYALLQASSEIISKPT